MPSLDLIRYRGKGPVGQKTRRARGQFQEQGARIQELGGAGSRKTPGFKSNHDASNQWLKVKDSALDKSGPGIQRPPESEPDSWILAPETDPATRRVFRPANHGPRGPEMFTIRSQPPNDVYRPLQPDRPLPGPCERGQNRDARRLEPLRE
jgi:hypothetical protein